MLPQEAIQQPHFHNMVGKSGPMLKIYELIEMVAPTRATVLIVGESGTGKELIARAIHDHSPRRDKPFIAVNCSAMADNLCESEMFGHEKGAFTGAIAMKKGRFELADQGTLFLDEVSVMSLFLQVKLLRVLQEMAFERVGGTRTIKVDVRFIAAANKDLKEGVQEGWFREDLFYRLNVIQIQLPPLRDHKEDIPPLVDHFVAKYACENKKDILGISNKALEVLMNYSFPGNIRELENIIERAVILTKQREITIQDLPEEISNGSGREYEAYASVKSDELLAVLRGATISDNGGAAKQWHRTLKCTTIETIHEFLLKTSQRPFSRLEFARFLSDKAKSDRNKYGTAGKYLSILKKNHICVHNKKKANQSRYRLSEVFLS
ncbi:MAG: sigma 54-interacting transcriptional regulator [Deltaproteobacteria bacterium]|nr:sigma 54-interacting transcriptional regulator [Deltaproteobacteria bacterium]MBW2020800.1 sigma 54-interacting transcriptional regulator [Deltaproteobacteria bacterium]MBW2073825.1 sigma 54-interacting transcriptional regulator [Deltaproteobacteria bacterium]